MATTVLSDRQVAQVLTDLARGQTTTKVADRRHLPEQVVLDLQNLYGPGQAALTKAAREATRRLRNGTPAEDLEVDVKVSSTEKTQPIPEPVPEPTVEDDIVLAACDHDGCDWVFTGPPNAAGGTISAAITDHQATHADAEADDNPAPAAGQLEIEVIKCAFCDYKEAGEGAWDLVVAHEKQVHRAEDLFVLNPDVPHTSEQQPVGAALEPDGKTGPSAAEESPIDPADPAPVPPGRVESALGEQSVERLLSLADQLDGQPRILAHAIREQVRRLSELVEDWQEARRRAIVLELVQLQERELDLFSELETLGEFEEIRAQLAVSTNGHQVPGLDSVSIPDKPIWFLIDRDVRRRVRDWAVDNGVAHAITGRQPAATIEAYLAAHPWDDPR